MPIAEENANNGKSKQRGVEHRPRSHHSGARRVCGARIVTGRTGSASDEPWRDLPEDRTAGGLLPEKQTEEIDQEADDDRDFQPQHSPLVDVGLDDLVDLVQLSQSMFDALPPLD